MQESSTSPLSDPIDLTGLVALAAGMVTGIGALVFLGWALDVEQLRRFPADPIVMLPNTAVGFILGGAALWLLRRPSGPTTSARVAQGLAVAVLLIGFLSFLERIAELTTGVNQILFVDRVARYPYRPVGLMATNSAICMTLAGISLLTMELETRRGWRPSQLAATAGVAIAALALVGHLYGARPLYAMDRAAGMALITALAFILLLLGLVFARARRGPVSLLTARDLGGVLTRRLLPATFLLPLLLGWLFIHAREESLISREGGIAVLVLSTIGVFLTLVLRSAVVVRSLDRERQAVLEREASARAEAEGANRAKSDFLAVMSHELRTPLNAIGGYVELMEMGVRGPLTAQQREDLARIRRSQTHLLGLINEVLNYTRIEAAAMRYDIAPVSANELMSAVEPLVAPLLSAKELSFTLVPHPTDDRVLADAERVRQIFINLLSNAVKFTAPGGRIALSSQPCGDMLAFHVADSGIGIPPDKTGVIFEPFVQIDARLTRAEQGMGLGLAISRDLARGMGGDLVVESREGAGSTFTLTLPRASNA